MSQRPANLPGQLAHTRFPSVVAYASVLVTAPLRSMVWRRSSRRWQRVSGSVERLTDK
jgi:hypothetical protein